MLNSKDALKRELPDSNFGLSLDEVELEGKIYTEREFDVCEFQLLERTYFSVAVSFQAAINLFHESWNIVEGHAIQGNLVDRSEISYHERTPWEFNSVITIGVHSECQSSNIFIISVY